jgi:hypothetical protein
MAIRLIARDIENVLATGRKTALAENHSSGIIAALPRNVYEAEERGCGLRIADCGLRIADCGLRIADCGLRIADWRFECRRHRGVTRE